MNARTDAPESGAVTVIPAAVPTIHTPEADKLLSMAIEKNLGIDQIDKLLAMRERLRAEAAKAAYLDAMARFQSECPVIKKNRTARVKSRRTGTEFTYKYAELGAIVKVAAPLIGKHGLSYIIRCELEKGEQPAMLATVTVSHVLGHSETSQFRAPIDAEAVVNDMQKAASASTFAKRQAFSNAFGILTLDEDDDGQSGGLRDDDGGDQSAPPAQQRGGPRARQEVKDDGSPATESQLKLIRVKMEQAGLSTEDMKKKLGYDLTGLTKAKVNTVLDWIRNPVA